MEKLDVAILGYGWASTAHIDALVTNPRARVSTVVSSRPLDADELSARHGCPLKCTSDLASVLDDPAIRVISICSYPHLHAEHIIAAAEAGKHLIIEKPITLTLDDARRVEEAVRKSGVRTCVCFECRYSSQMLATKALIDRGLLGSLHYGEVDYYHGIGPWYGQFRWNTRKASGGSSLLSAGCHALDALRLCMGDEIESVYSLSTKSANAAMSQYEYDSTSVTTVRFAGGAIGKVASSIDCLQPYTLHTHLVGSEGSLLDDRFHSDLLHAEKDTWSRLSMKLIDSGDVADHPYPRQFEAFFESLERGETMPLTSLDEAMKTHLAVLAADLSALENRPVKISELQ